MLRTKDALKKLIDGNQRFLKNESIHPNRCQEARLKLLDGQNPFAVIISCSDSRVPTEIIFDAGLGDLFIIRSAGHALSTASLGSIEFALENLGVKLIMVLGHDDCSAVKAAICNIQRNALPENLKSVVNKFIPAVESAKNDKYEGEELLKHAIKNNVLNTVNDLIQTEPVIAKHIREHDVQIIGANYNLITGEVEIYEQQAHDDGFNGVVL
jgi:carbonic anhydrase